MRQRGHTYYLKRGCPDLIVPGIEVACPNEPFLATLVSPPWHRNVEVETVKSAFRLRNAVAALILQSDWFVQMKVH